MAKKPKKTPKVDEAIVEDAEVVTPDSGDDVPDVTAESDDISSEQSVGEDQPDDGFEKIEEVLPEPVVAPVVQEEKRSVFLPLVFGGLIAGGLGYGASYLTNQNTENDLAALSTKLASETKRADAAEDRLGALEQQLSAKMDSSVAIVSPEALDAKAEELRGESSQAFSTFETRLTAVEKRPDSEGGADDAAVAAYQRELDAIRAELEAQQTRNAALAEEFSRLETNAQSSLAEAAAQAEAIKASAEAAAKKTAARAALVQIQAALESGSEFAAPLATLQDASDVDVPDALAQAAGDGIATLADLQGSIAPAARAALAASRGASDEASGGTGRLAAFLQNQLGTRSLEPREGNDPDAVLSRVEAAVRQGDLSAALVEIEALPEAGRAEMADWEAAAKLRAAALESATALADRLSQN